MVVLLPFPLRRRKIGGSNGGYAPPALAASAPRGLSSRRRALGRSRWAWVEDAYDSLLRLA